MVCTLHVALPMERFQSTLMIVDDGLSKFGLPTRFVAPQHDASDIVSLIHNLVIPCQVGANSVSWAPAIWENQAQGSTAPAILGGSGSANATLSPRRLASGGCDNVVRVWRLSGNGSWEQEDCLERHKAWVNISTGIRVRTTFKEISAGSGRGVGT